MIDSSDAFGWANSVAMIGWALLIFTPRWKYTQGAINFAVLPVLFGVAYAFLIFSNLGNTGLDFSSMEAVRQLFSNDEALLAGWIHYLAFDLIVGALILKNGQKQGLHHAWLIPCLLGTFMLGPVGFLLYTVLRLALRKTATWD